MVECPVRPATLDHLASAFSGPSRLEAAVRVNPEAFAAVDRFWRAVHADPHLSPRMKELVLLALHASSSSLNEDAIARHVRRSLTAGASEADVVDVLVTIIPLANHPLYVAVPALLDELEKAGRSEAKNIPSMTTATQAIKDDFVRSRGYWTELRDLIARIMPDYFTAFINACMEPWRSGSLTSKEREMIYIAIDCSVAHTYEPGLRMHIRNAIRYGADRDEILAVFQLAALMGVEGYLLGTSALAEGGPAPSDPGVRAATSA